MTPWEKAKQVYENEPCARSLEYDMELHLLNGFVYSTPWFFVMGRPVDRMGDPALIVNPAFKFPPERLNTWHCYIFAGHLSYIWDILPWRYPFVSYERQNVLRFAHFDTIKRLSRK